MVKRKEKFSHPSQAHIISYNIGLALLKKSRQSPALVTQNYLGQTAEIPFAAYKKIFTISQKFRIT